MFLESIVCFCLPCTNFSFCLSVTRFYYFSVSHRLYPFVLLNLCPSVYLLLKGLFLPRNSCSPLFISQLPGQFVSLEYATFSRSAAIFFSFSCVTAGSLLFLELYCLNWNHRYTDILATKGTYFGSELVLYDLD